MDTRTAEYNVATASGDVSYAGIGFKLSYVLMLASVVNTSGMSVGMGNVAAPYCIYDKPGGITWGPNTTLIVVFVTGSDYITGIIKSMDADGVTGSTGAGSAHNNVQPYIVVYMWKRTA